MSRINILGVYLDKITKKGALKRIEKLVEKSGSKYVVTPNPEILLQSEQDEEFFYILNQAELSLPDGIGIKIASWFLGKNLYRIPGADLTEELLEVAQKKQWPVGIINYREGLSSDERIKQALQKRFPGLRVMVFSSSREEKEIKDFRDERLRRFQPRIILAGLGAPWQEKLLFHSLKNFPEAGVGLGIGGSLDFLTGRLDRAPKLLRIMGLEWLWRLLKQPSRVHRIYRAVLVFPWKFIQWRFILPFKYRSSVSCLLYKKDQEGYKILVVERKEQKGRWQLPQGGTEGEDIVTAGSRELREELNCGSFRPRAVYKNLHRYKFPKKGGTSKHRGYKGQKQSLLIAEFTGEDSDIAVNFWEHQNWKWVDKEELLKVVQPVRKKGTQKYLNKFEQFVNSK